MKVFSKKRLYLLLSAIFFIAAWFIQPDLNRQGLIRNQTQLERIAFLTSNDLTESDALHIAQWSGYLFSEKPSEIYFRIPRDVDAKLTIADEVVFNSKSTDKPANDKAVFYSSSGAQSITLEIIADVRSQIYFQGGLEWQTLFGWQIVPATHLYPSPPDPNLAQQTILRSYIAQTLFGLAITFVLIALVVHYSLTLHVSSLVSNLQDLIRNPLFLITLLALALRFLILPSLVNDFLPFGSDHRGYQASAIDFLRGTFPNGAFYVQPGMSLFMGAIYSVIGVNIRAIQVIQLISGALITLLVFDLARRIFDKTTAYIAAILWAIFPLPIFYETQVLTHGFEPHLAILLLWLWYRAVEKSRQWLVVLGLTLGISAIMRPTFLIIAPFMVLSLFWVHRANMTRMILVPLALAVITFIPIAPITWHNYHASNGSFQLLTSNSDVNIYLGNNRDTNGQGHYSPAFLATHTLVRQGKTTYIKQTLGDIRDDPKRWLQLMLRKTALYLGDPELPNNADFYRDGTERSALLALLPIRFGGMTTLSIVGIIFALIQNRKWGSGLLLTYILTQFGVTLVYHLWSRFRAPIYSVLPIFAAYAVVIIIQPIHQRQMRQALQRFLLATASGAFIAFMPTFAESVMSKPILSSIPSSAKIINAKINDSITLVGYEPLPVVQPGDPFFVTLYWESHPALLDKDYFATMQFFTDINTGQKVAQTDQAIGTGSFPDYPTSQWRADQIIWDRYFIEMPNASTPQSLTVLVAVYNRETGQRLGETTFGYLPLTKKEPLTIPLDAKTINAKIGTATLSGYKFDADLQSLIVNLYWLAGDPMPDAKVFIHIYNADGNFLFGQDTRPHNGTYSTQAWQRSEGIVDEHRITLPPNLPKGNYIIKVGMYDTATQNRLTATDEKGELIEDGSVIVGTFTK